MLTVFLAFGHRADAHEDGLPDGATLRFGTTRLRLTSRVFSLSFSGDGKTLASADDRGHVRVWEAETGKLRFALPADTGTTAVLSPDGKLLATGVDRKPIRLWSAADGKALRTLADRGFPSLAFAADSKALLCVDQPENVLLVDVETGKEVRRFAGTEWFAEAVAISADGKSAAAACDLSGKKTVVVWDAETGKERRRVVDADQRRVYDLCLSAEGKVLAAGGSDHVHLWDLAGDKEPVKFAYPAAQYGIAFDASGKRLVTGGRSVFTGGIGADGNYFDGEFVPNYGPEQLVEWSVATGKEIRRLEQWGSLVTLTKGGEHLMVCTMSVGTAVNSNEEGPFHVLTGNVTLVDAAAGDPRLLIEGHGSVAAVTADGRLLATATGSDFHAGGKTRPERGTPAAAGAPRLWETLTGQEVLRFAGDPPTALAFAPDGRHLLIGTRAGTVSLVETAPPGVGDNGKLDRKVLEAFWTDLASGDAAVAYRAQSALSAARDEAPAFLAERLRPAPADDAVVMRLIADLEAERYVVRRAAFAELARRGAEAEPALRAALKRADSQLVKRRLEELLGAPTIKVFPEPLRRLRAAQVLERIGTPEAKKILTDLPSTPELRDR